MTLSISRRLASAILAAGVAAALGSASSTASSQAAAESTYVYAEPAVLADPAVRPTRIILAADGNDAVSGLRWSDWGRPFAYGNGTERIEHCQPSCATGAVTRQQVEVVLSHPQTYARRRMYACYRVRYRYGNSGIFCLPKSSDG
jgi:hypothetical protein